MLGRSSRREHTSSAQRESGSCRCESNRPVPRASLEGVRMHRHCALLRRPIRRTAVRNLELTLTPSRSDRIPTGAVIANATGSIVGKFRSAVTEYGLGLVRLQHFAGSERLPDLLIDGRVRACAIWPDWWPALQQQQQHPASRGSAEQA